MSSSDELVRGIRRIVGEQEEKPTGLGNAEARKAIGISRGVGLVRSDGSVGGGGGEGGGDDTSPPDVPVEQPDSGADVPGDGGNVGGTDNGGKGEVSGDAAEVFDGVTANSKVGTVTGTDPATGTLTSINFDSLAGIEYTPPDGWDDPDVYPYTWIENDPTAYASCAGAFGGSATDYQNGGTWTADDGTLRCYIGGVFQGVALKTPPAVTCASLGGDPDLGGFCDVQESTPESSLTWPSDSTCDIAYDHDQGGYKGHDKDPDCSTAQKTASTCYTERSQSEPSRYFRFCRLADGGTKITEVDSGGAPVPGTITKILDGQGNVIGFVDVALDNFYQ